MNRKRSNLEVMMRLIGLVKPLTGYMILAICMGLIGHLCAAFLTVLAGYGILHIIGLYDGVLVVIFLIMGACALVRGILRYAEQACNHFIAFKLLALIRDKVFQALRRLCPAKLEGKDKGDLIAVITSDIELLEVFYAHTISPSAIALLFTIIMCAYIGHFHWILGVIALLAYITVGIVVPVMISRANGENGMLFRKDSGVLSGFVLDSLRGLTETIQYGQGEKRLEKMNRKTDILSVREEQMKQIAGRNQAITNTVILAADLIMLFAAVMLYQRYEVGYAGVILPVLALMSSFGPVVALAGLGSTLQNTFAAGNRVLDILDEKPVIEDITGYGNIDFAGAKAEDVSFAYGDETILQNVSVEIPQKQIIGLIGRSGSGKSTLTSAYLARGYHLMADDMSFVSYHNETVMAKAAFPYQKLCRDAALRSGHPLDSLIYIDEAKDKYLVPCHEIFDDTSRPVKAIIILGKAPVSQVWLHKLEGLDAFHACVNNLFLRHLLKEKKYAPATAGQCLKIASKVPVYVILRPLEADTTGEVIETAFAITSKVR